MNAKSAAAHRQRGWTLGVMLALLIGICLWSVLPAAAHASLLSAEPSAGTTLTEPPETVVLTFSEPMGASSQIALISEGFQRSNLTVTVDGSVMVATVPELGAGVYTVQYDAVSADGHNILGSYEFAIEPPNRVPLIALAVGLLLGVLLRGVFSRRRRDDAADR